MGGHSAGSFPAASAAHPGNASYLLLPENSWHAKLPLFLVDMFFSLNILDMWKKNYYVPGIKTENSWQAKLQLFVLFFHS